MSNAPARLDAFRTSFEAIGYSPELIKSNFRYADLERNEGRVIPLAAFAQHPPDYRNSCIGVFHTDGSVADPERPTKHLFLGAPILFEIMSDKILLWRAHREREYELAETLNPEHVGLDLLRRSTEFEPSSIVCRKTDTCDQSHFQLEFPGISLVDYVAKIVHKRLDELLTHLLVVGKRWFSTREKELDWHLLYRIIFRLIAAKVFHDRKHLLRMKFDNAEAILTAVDKFYDSTQEFLSPNFDFSLPQQLWEELQGTFNFQNISVEDLAFVYENSFIKPEVRKALGVHGTPFEIATYVVETLPFEQLPQGALVFEPCCGSGVFLVSALRRLKTLMAEENSRERHKKLRKQLWGIELDRFAVEICKLSLMLADYPNADGWNVVHGDFFSDDSDLTSACRADVVLCNPPFEKLSPEQRSGTYVYAAAEALDRVLRNPPLMLGFIFPRSFLSTRSSRKLHTKLVEIYGEIELLRINKSVFSSSDVESVVVMAWERKAEQRPSNVRCASVVPAGSSLHSVITKATNSRRIVTLVESKQKSFSLWEASNVRLWDYLSFCPKVRDFYEIHQGLHWKTEEKLGEDPISSVPKADYRKGYKRRPHDYGQYRLSATLEYLSFRPEHNKDKNYLFPWDQPKLVVNSSRFERDTPWRLAAAVDYDGLAFSKNYFALWPKGDVSLEYLCLVMNSPVANAFHFERCRERYNLGYVIEQIPLPLRREEERAKNLYRQFTEALDASDDSLAYKLLLWMDALVLEDYDLPPALEHDLLDLFTDFPRPVPFHFSHYPSRELQAHIPLRCLLSEEFSGSTVEKFLQQEPIKDAKIQRVLKMLSEGDL